MGVPQSIPFTELLSYCELEGLGRYDAQELLGFVRRLDQVYFEDIEAKAKVKNRGLTGHFALFVMLLIVQTGLWVGLISLFVELLNQAPH
jgi:hypothetical protein